MFGMNSFVLAVLGRFASPLFGIFAFLFGVAFFVVGLLVLYFAIKTATKNALKEYYDERELKERRTQSSA